MFTHTMTAAIDAARTLANMDELSRAIWQAHASGAVDDGGAQALAERLHAQRAAIRGAIVPVGIPAGRASLFPKRRHPVSPDRLASRDRRRLLAASGPMPPQLAARFTVGQLAVLKIVGEEAAGRGLCALCIDAIAARAGVCRRLAQAALRLAEGDGLLTIQERRHQGRKNEANLVRVISREWQAWLRRGSRGRPEGGGCRPLHTTVTGVQGRAIGGPAEAPEGCREAAVAPGRANPTASVSRPNGKRITGGASWTTPAEDGPAAPISSITRERAR